MLEVREEGKLGCHDETGSAGGEREAVQGWKGNDMGDTGGCVGDQKDL